LATYFGESLATSDPFQGYEYLLKLRWQGWTLAYRQFDKLFHDFLIGDSQGNGLNRLDFDDESVKIQYKLVEDLWSVSVFTELHEQANSTVLQIANADISSQFWWTDGSVVASAGGNETNVKQWHSGVLGEYSGLSHHKLNFGIDFRKEEITKGVFQGNWDAEVLRTSFGESVVPSTIGIQQGFWYPGDGIRDDILPLVEREISSLYLQDSWTLSEALNLTIGGRFDEYSDIGGAFSKRIGLVYNFSSTATVKVMYGEAFQAPTLGQVYTTPSSSRLGNLDLRPETIDTLDLSWSQTFSHAQFVVTHYRSRTHDQIVSVVVPGSEFGTTRLQAQNTDSDELSGWEFELNANPAENLLLRLGYSHSNQQSDFGVSKDLAFVVLDLAIGGWNFDINGYYHGHVISRLADADRGRISLDSFWKFNTAVSYQLSEDIRLFGTVENVLNKSYETYDEFSQLDSGLPERGRIASFGLRVDF